MLRLQLLKKLRRTRRAVFVKMRSTGEGMSALTSYRQRRISIWPLAVMLVIAFLILIADLLARLGDMMTWISSPDGQTAYAFWIGTKSIFDIVTALMTTLIAIIAAFLALRGYRVNQRAAIANRYQKGVELLGAAADSSKLGGIELLSIVAREAPREYQEPVIRTVRQFLQERCAATVEAVYIKREMTDPAALPATDFVVIAALSAVTRTHMRQRWLELEYDDEGLALRGICLHKVRFVSSDFSRMRFEEAVLGEIHFESCNFAETFIDARCLGIVTFDNCTFNKFDILAADIQGERLHDAEAFINVSRSRRAYTFRVNGKPVSAPT